MDPIHPIAPVPPNIPPVGPTPLIGRIDREGRRPGPEEKRRRRQPRSGPTSAEHGIDEPGGDDDSGLHINVTA